MASTSATLSLCSSVAAHCNVASHRSSPCLVSLSKPSISLAKIVPGFLAPPVGSSRPAFPLAPKFAESESPVVDSDPDASDSEPVETAEDAEIALEKPKREEVLLSSWLGGRQYIVFPGKYLYTQRLKDANVNDEIVLNKVVLVGTKTLISENRL